MHLVCVREYVPLPVCFLFNAKLVLKSEIQRHTRMKQRNLRGSLEQSIHLHNQNMWGPPVQHPFYKGFCSQISQRLCFSIMSPWRWYINLYFHFHLSQLVQSVKNFQNMHMKTTIQLLLCMTFTDTGVYVIENYFKYYVIKICHFENK